MPIKKIWVRSKGNLVYWPHPQTKTKPPIGAAPVLVPDTPDFRRLINHRHEPLELCAPPKTAVKTEDKEKTPAKKGKASEK